MTLGEITSGDSAITIDADASSDQITINDDDVASATITASVDAAEPDTDGLFTVTLTNPASVNTVITYVVTGTANTGDISGNDFTPLSNSVTVLAGQTTATIAVEVLDDAILETTETLVVTLNSLTSGDENITLNQDPAIITISDDDASVLSVFASDPGAAEQSDSTELTSETLNPGEFTFRLTKASDVETVVEYSVSGTADPSDDYTPLSGTATIAAGETSVTVDVLVADDGILEETESVTVTVASVTGNLGHLDRFGFRYRDGFD